jgi:hypothetical protein
VPQPYIPEAPRFQVLSISLSAAALSIRLGMTAPASIEEVLDDFFAAVAEAGRPAPEEPISAEDLAAVADAVAPLRLPPSLVATWRRFQTGESTLLTWMPMQEALRGLEMWREDFAGVRVLFPLAYESHEFLLVELATSATAGGALFRWAYDGDPAQPVFPDLEAAFACAAEGWRRGLLGSWEDAARNEWSRLSETYAPATGYPEHLAPFEAIDLARPLSWPPVWQEASGIDPAAAEPRGSTTTVRALRDGQAQSGTIVGRIAGLAGTGAGSRVVVDDGTGEIVVWCPAASDPFTAVVVGQHIELDVTLTSGDENRSSREFDAVAAGIGTSATAGDLAAAQAYALELASFIDPAAADALATAARPLGQETRWGQTKLRDGHDAP